MQQVKQQQKEEGFDTAKDYEDNFPSLGGDLGGTEEFDENDEQYEDVEGDECEEIIIDEDDDKTIQAFTGGGVRNVFHLVQASTTHWSILKPGLGRFTLRSSTRSPGPLFVGKDLCNALKIEPSRYDYEKD